MKTLDLLKALADAVDSRRVTSHAARAARLAYEAAPADASSQKLDALWAASRAATAISKRTQAAHDNQLAIVRVYLSNATA